MLWRMSHQMVNVVTLFRVSGRKWRAWRTLATRCPVLMLDNMNARIKQMEYAVRGPLVLRAVEIEKELSAGKKKPFDEVLRANIGDCHAMGQIPMTFLRQVIALVSYPPLLELDCFPEDVKDRAKCILHNCGGGSIGSYTPSAGIELIRRHVAQFIERRDGGVPSDCDDIILSTGASNGIECVLNLLVGEVEGQNTGVMVPIPQYPLYSATLVAFGLDLVGYHLDEDNEWSLDLKELQRAYDGALQRCRPRALVVINPGNPTGQVLTEENIRDVVCFAQANRLLLLCDEVYQDNVYAPGSKFHSMKKVIAKMGPPYCTMELASFMSMSKGYMGECGLRAGYVELFNIVPEVKAMLIKSISAKLCPPVLGQVAVECVVNPPCEGDPSYEQFVCEKKAVLESLALRATMVGKAFNSAAGMSCNTVQGAMYAFPRVCLPEKVVARAKELGMTPDTMYAYELLDNTGICVVPGSGFGQKEGTYHFRTTILPQPEKLKVMLAKMVEFHNTFMAKYK